MTRRPAIGGSLLAALAIVLLSGCTPAGADATAAPTPSPTSTPEPAPNPTPVAAPAATCDTVLTEAEYAALAEDGLELVTDAAWQLGPAMSDLTADGALVCEWHAANGDVAVWFAQLPEDDAEWTGRRTELETSGWTVSDDPFAGTMRAPADYDANYQPSMLHVDGVTFFVSYGTFLQSVAALQSA